MWNLSNKSIKERLFYQRKPMLKRRQLTIVTPYQMPKILKTSVDKGNSVTQLLGCLHNYVITLCNALLLSIFNIITIVLSCIRLDKKPILMSLLETNPEGDHYRHCTVCHDKGLYCYLKFYSNEFKIHFILFQYHDVAACRNLPGCCGMTRCCGITCHVVSFHW